MLPDGIGDVVESPGGRFLAKGWNIGARWALLKTLLLAAGLALHVACGGDDKAPAPTPIATTAAGGAQPQASSSDGAIFIPSIEVGAPLTVKVLVAGQPLPSPDGPNDVAIYDFGSDAPGLGGVPGEGGNVVLSGLNLAVEGCIRGEPPCDAVFRRLRTVDAGSNIDLLWQAETYRYQVVAMCSVPTANFGDGIYRRTTEEQLTLLTGAGNWRSDSGWSHVLIVIAKPAPRTALEPCPEGTRTGRP